MSTKDLPISSSWVVHSVVVVSSKEINCLHARAFPSILSLRRPVMWHKEIEPVSVHRNEQVIRFLSRPPLSFVRKWWWWWLLSSVVNSIHSPFLGDVLSALPALPFFVARLLPFNFANAFAWEIFNRCPGLPYSSYVDDVFDFFACDKTTRTHSHYSLASPMSCTGKYTI